MARLFGTDGIRGPADSEVFADSSLRRIAGGIVAFLRLRKHSVRLRIVVGRDPRASGERIERVLVETFSRLGVEVWRAGIVPTPAVARAVLELSAELGVVLTASHNPASDNGIKLFGPEGGKLPVKTEASIEAAISECDAIAPSLSAPIPPREYDAGTAYLRFATGCLSPNALAGWKIAVDTAHGATTHTTPAVLRALGAEVLALGDAPDGENINDGVGSEHPEALQTLVRSSGARLGIAHDGDGDRVILVDERGDVVEGDCLLGMLALDRLRHGGLAGETLVVTVMSNLALDRAVERAGGRVVRAGVGDRQVAEVMLRHGHNLGGESSGHVIVRDWLPTGDGLLAALSVLEVMVRTGRALSDLAHPFELYPQLQRNLRVAAKPPLETISNWRPTLAEFESGLDGKGRILVRYSGTEPKIRLLVEAENQTLAEKTMEHLDTGVRGLLPVVD